MANTNTIARSMHDIGLATWFGGSLMGAVGVNGASGEVDEPKQRARVANTAWSKWTPVNLAGIAAHVGGSIWLIGANKGRIGSQRGVGTMSLAKTVLTGAALGATAYSRVLGQRIIAEGDVPVESGTRPSSDTPEHVAAAQKQLKLLQWAIPALTGTLLVISAKAGEQQRPAEVAKGIVGRVLPDSIAARIAA